MITGQALVIAICVALTLYLGEEAIIGVKWVGHEAAKAGHAIVHLIKKVPHPHDTSIHSAPPVTRKAVTTEKVQ